MAPLSKLLPRGVAKKKMRSVPVLLCLMRASRLEWKNEKCACDQQGSNALVMVFSFKLSTETRDMRRSQTKPAVHCFAGGRFMLPWMTENDSHVVLTLFFLPTRPICYGLSQAPADFEIWDGLRDKFPTCCSTMPPAVARLCLCVYRNMRYCPTPPHR